MHYLGSVAMKPSADQYEFIENQYGDRYIARLLDDVLAFTSAEFEYKRRFGNDIFKENTLYAVIGTDCGLLPDYLIKNGLPKGSRYIFIESDDILPLIDKKHISGELHERIVICNNEEWPSAVRGMTLSNYAYTGMISIVRSISARVQSNTEYAILSDFVTRDLNHIHWMFSSQFDEHVFIRTALANIPENRIPVIQLRNLFEGRSAIVMAAGPSLDELIPWIKEHRNDAILISVSRISNRLLQAGIHPDFVCSIDPQYISFSVSKEMYGFSENTVFVNGSNASPLLVGQWPHRMLYAGERIPWGEDDAKNLKVIAPTVTNNAIMLAIMLGCKEIILAGVDLCYSAEGYTHASGTKEHNAGPLIGKNEKSVTTNSGKTAETNAAYYEAMTTIERQAAGAYEDGIVMINPSPDACRMTGVSHVTVNNIEFKNKPEEPVWATISRILDKDTCDDRTIHYKKMRDILRSAVKPLKNIKTLATEAARCNELMKESMESRTISTHKERMDRIERILDKRYGRIGNTIKSYGAEKFSKIITAASENDIGFNDLIDRMAIYYNAYAEVPDILIETIESSIDRIESRIEEESSSPDIVKMTSQWKKDMHYGRAITWKNRHKETYLSLTEDDRIKIDSLESLFHEFMRSEETKLINHFNGMASDINTTGRIIGSAITFYEKKNTESLMRLYKGLLVAKTPLSDQALNLVHGFIHELEGDFSSARTSFNRIDKTISNDMHQIGQEHILLHEISTNDYESALLTLESLSRDIDSYLPFYAKLLKETGDIKRSIGVYTEYLYKNPRDTTSIEELEKILTEIGATDAAATLQEHLKEISSNNP